MSFLQQPLTQIFIRPIRKIGQLAVSVIISESTNDTLTITKQPVQQGASITDHAFKEPTTLQMSAYFQDNQLINVLNAFSDLSQSPMAQFYQKLLDLQISRIPFDVITPKRVYKNVLMASVQQTTDKNTENTLAVLFSFQEVIIVQVGNVTVPRSRQRNPGVTGATENAGKKSALLTLKEGIGALTGH